LAENINKLLAIIRAYIKDKTEKIDLQNPFNEGWDSFKKYRDDILEGEES